MYSSLWRILKPFERDYVRYLLGVFLRQGLLVASGYSMVLALRLCTRYTSMAEWVFVVAFVVYDAGLLGLDLGLNTFYSAHLSYPLFGKLRTAALRKVFEMPLEWHHRKESGRLAGDVNQGVGKVVQTAESVSRELIPALMRTVLSLIPLLLVSAVSVPAALVALSAFLWLSLIENRKREPFRRRRYRNYTKDHGMFAECVRQVRPVVQFGQARRLLDTYGQVQKAIVEQGVEEIRVGNSYAFHRNMLLSITKRACQGIWIYQYRKNALDAAMVMYLSMLLDDLLTSFWSYAALLDRIFDGLEPTRILVKLFDEIPAIANDASTSAETVPETVGIRMVNIGFAYPGRDRVMQDFNLAIEPGTVVGIVGRSGGGKTTIHSLLARMFDIQQGAIEVCGKDIRRWPLEQLRGMISCVTQDGGVFFSEMNIADTLRFGRPDASMSDVIASARCACIHDDIMNMPFKYKTRLGERGVMLSKGQQQRIALAQALVALNDEKKVLILDEFTSALDSETERRLIENIRPFLRGKTAIIIAHRLSTVRNIADRIVVVDHGRIAEQGSHEELLAQGGWYARMARIQAIA
jgi:ABC-type multidrug transport system fused ATPase/permease subunit